MSIDSRLKALERLDLAADPMVVRFYDGDTERDGSLDQMIQRGGIFVKVISGGGEREAMKMLDYVLDCFTKAAYEDIPNE